MGLSWTTIEATAGTLGRVDGLLARTATGLREGTLGGESLARVLRAAGDELVDGVRVIDAVGEATSPVRLLAEPIQQQGIDLLVQSGHVRARGIPADAITLARQLDEAAVQARDAAGMLRQEAHYARTAQGAAEELTDATLPIRVDDLHPPTDPELIAKELAELEARVATRTPAGNAEMTLYGKFGNKAVWEEYLTRLEEAHGPERAAVARRELHRAWELSVETTERMKVLQPRDRPFAHSTLLADNQIAHHPDSLSFPSGHTAVTFASARVLARHWPERAEEFMSIADRVAESRLYAGVHWPSDVAAGRVIGERVDELVARGG